LALFEGDSAFLARFSPPFLLCALLVVTMTYEDQQKCNRRY
jgi:hypothetical protein